MHIIYHSLLHSCCTTYPIYVSDNGEKSWLLLERARLKCGFDGRERPLCTGSRTENGWNAVAWTLSLVITMMVYLFHRAVVRQCPLMPSNHPTAREYAPGFSYCYNVWTTENSHAWLVTLLDNKGSLDDNPLAPWSRTANKAQSTLTPTVICVYPHYLFENLLWQTPTKNTWLHVIILASIKKYK